MNSDIRCLRSEQGDIAQLVERYIRIVEAAGSNPAISTNIFGNKKSAKALAKAGFCLRN